MKRTKRTDLNYAKVIEIRQQDKRERSAGIAAIAAYTYVYTHNVGPYGEMTQW